MFKLILLLTVIVDGNVQTQSLNPPDVLYRSLSDCVVQANTAYTAVMASSIEGVPIYQLPNISVLSSCKDVSKESM